MDFLTDLLELNEHNALLVIVDKFSKLSRLVPCRSGEGWLTAPEVTTLFFNNWVCFFGVPHYVLHDRQVRFTVAFWKALFFMMGTNLLFSSLYHPQTNGQMECQNYTIEQLVRVLVYEDYNWVECLIVIEFALNNAMTVSTGISTAHVMDEQSLCVLIDHLDSMCPVQAV